MARKTKEEALETREAIIDAAIQLFANQGIFPTTLVNIAEKAGVTRGAIYHHFKNKEDLLDYIKSEIIFLFEPVIRLVEESKGLELNDVLGAVEQACIAFFRNLKDDPRQLQLHQIHKSYCEEVERDGVLQSRSSNKCFDGLQKLENLLPPAVKQGQLHANFNVRFGSIAIHSFFVGLMNTWIEVPSLMDVDTDVPALFHGMTQMLSAQGIRRKVFI